MQTKPLAFKPNSPQLRNWKGEEAWALSLTSASHPASEGRASELPYGSVLANYGVNRMNVDNLLRQYKENLPL